MNPDRFHIDFYETPGGHRPVHRWLTSELTVRQRRLVGVAMYHYLQRFGVDVCASGFGKALGDGLYEFRVRHDLPELLRRVGIEHRSMPDEGAPAKVLIRVFFSVHGGRVVLLLGGYDKAKSPTTKRQQREIQTARARLREWRSRETQIPP
ncbi:MAG: hypothetical protein H7287_14840 [Thermoleophilia bacterium]|nr:hypothetical protein [Thermoleophilia bacterium]